MRDEEFLKFVNELKANPADLVARLQDEEFVNFLHGVIGLSTEAGELLDICKKYMAYGKPIDREHVLEEAGDALHYLGYIFDFLGQDNFTTGKESNLAKLKQRYPEGFTEDAAIARADKDPETDDVR